MTQGDYLDVLRVIDPGSLSDQDVAYATYIFDYLAGHLKDSRLYGYAASLATEYAHRFAGWLGYVFMNRANLTQKSKAMKALEDGLGNWVEGIPGSFKGAIKVPSDYLIPEAERFLKMDKIDALGEKVVKVVKLDWMKQGSGIKNASWKVGMAEGLDTLPITYDSVQQRYEIPTSRLTYVNRAKLKELGFSYGGNAWYTDVLDSKILDELPQAAKMQRAPAVQEEPMADPPEWFFDKWLPQNIDRFTKAFNSYGRSEGVPYTFRFQLIGREVVVKFQRNIDSIGEAIAELRSRYGGSSDRDGWMTAVECYGHLMSAQGKQAIHAIDTANNLEHSHGAMMEHFPPGVRSWYPRFLDFKYTAHVEQMVKMIVDEDLRVCATELLPDRDISYRLVTPKTDYRTPKGLALEISSQPGKAKKRQMLKEVLVQHPELAHRVLGLLEDRGLDLGVKLEDVGLGTAFKSLEEVGVKS